MLAQVYYIIVADRLHLYFNNVLEVFFIVFFIFIHC